MSLGENPTAAWFAISQIELCQLATHIRPSFRSPCLPFRHGVQNGLNWRNNHGGHSAWPHRTCIAAHCFETPLPGQRQEVLRPAAQRDRSLLPQALVSLDAGGPTGPTVKAGQQLAYTGMKLKEPASGKMWAVVLSDDGGLWKFPAAELAYCNSGMCAWAVGWPAATGLERPQAAPQHSACLA